MNENWKTFNYTSKDGISIRIEWWPKDFVASFESDGIKLSTGLHIMYMCPKKYTEEILQTDYCEDSCRILKRAYDLLQNHPTFVEDYKNKMNSNSILTEKINAFAALQEERRQKRNQFKAGKLSQREWTIFCKQYNKASCVNSCEKSDFTRSFVSRFTGGDTTLQNILMDYLKRFSN